VDLVSFYILRSLNDDPEAKNNDLSLIPFPYQDLFSTELEKFDAVILQNFDFNLYFDAFYLGNLANFVREGGSLLMIGGDQAFHKYRGSPLEPLLPFSFAGEGDFEIGNFPAQVMTKHPMVSGLELAFQIPQWTARHRIVSRSSATDLVRYRSGAPFISFQQAEKGRVLAINTDESWKLQMEPIPGAPAFGRLARHVLQYLTFDSEMDTRNLLSENWHVGHDVNLWLASGEKANWSVRPLWSTNPEVKTFKQVSNVKFHISEPGLFAVTCSLIPDPVIFETEEQPWREEWKTLLSSNEKLKKLSKNSGGEFYDYAHRAEVLKQPLSGRQIISAQVESWSHTSSLFSWLVLLGTLGLLCLDFFFRKKSFWDA